ncbi:MAG: polysaccharide deacetylase family protein [Balneola sp.]|nr:polysaccharide deacetylase family protein [Balneola sp.]MBO6800081.1 polysaccharide deacetylase family protein [Balneola sp.]MBO6871538.1 polysaccharide deacetylase family protein [Balneola sp.]
MNMRNIHDLPALETPKLYLDGVSVFSNPLAKKRISSKPLSAKKVKNSPKVLMYHRVVEDKNISGNETKCVHVDEFRKQLEVLEKFNYTPITFEDYSLHTQNLLRLPQKPVIITFDDGYVDTYDVAFPIMKEFGMNGVLFALGNRSILTNKWDEDQEDISRAELMNNEQLVELHKNGFEIGAHTLNHPNLKDLSPEDCYEEISNSKVVLESIIGEKVRTFSYPYGFVNKRLKKLVAKSGFDFACGVYSGPVTFSEDLMEIRRLEVKNTTSVIGFASKLLTPYEYLEYLWWKFKKQ